MRKMQFRRMTFLIVALLITIAGLAQHRVVILHSTVSTIERMIWMVDNKIIDIPDIELIGAYPSNEVYDYNLSEKYLTDNHIKICHLIKIEADIKPEEIYRENGCTQVFRKLFNESDAIIFFGGPDIPASLYGEKQNLLTVVTDPHRHYFETSLFFHLIGGSRNPAFKPFLADRPEFIVRAFCLGMQTMNVAAGGTLIQDIPQEIYHINTLEEMTAIPSDNRHRSYVSQFYPLTELFEGNFHPIKPSPNSYLQGLASQAGVLSPVVLSSHHQAVGRKSPDLRVIATSMDGKIIEGLQHVVYKEIIGFQFHPEVSSLYKPEAKFAAFPGSTFSPYELLNNSKSLSFHKLFWRDFSEKVKSSKRIPTH